MANGREKRQNVDAEAKDFLARLTGTWDIDDDLEELFWAYASKDMVLSNLSRADIDKMMKGFQDSVNDYIIQQPEHEYTWGEQMAVGQFEDWLYIRLNRSYQGFERKMQKTGAQISKQILEGNVEEDGMREKMARFVGKGSSEEEKEKRVPQI